MFNVSVTLGSSSGGVCKNPECSVLVFYYLLSVDFLRRGKTEYIFTYLRILFILRLIIHSFLHSFINWLSTNAIPDIELHVDIIKIN